MTGPVEGRDTAGPIERPDLEALARHLEYGHLEGQDYDAVEWLLAEHERLTGACGHEHVDGWFVGIEGCRGCGRVVDWHDGEQAPVFAEVERLRAALRDIASRRCLGSMPPGCVGGCVTCVARVALANAQEVGR